VSTLYHGRALLTGRLDEPEIAGGGLVEQDGTILDVGPADTLRLRHSIDREVGGADRLVMPGLVSAHQHGGGVSSVQLGCSDQAFERWIIRMLGVPPLDPYLDTLFHAVRFIERGITTTIHSHYTRNPTRYEDEIEAHLRAWSESGIRVTFAPCFLNSNQFVYGANEAFIRSLPSDLGEEATRLLDLGPDVEDYVALVRTLRDRASRGSRNRVLLGPVAPQWCTKDALERMAELGDPSWGIHTHLLESPAQRDHLDKWLERSVVDWLDELGFVNPNSSFAHGVWLRPDEIDILAARGAHVVHNPSSNLRVQTGLAAIASLRSAGVSIGLGTDDMTLTDDDDLLGEARLAGVLARARGTAIGPAELLNMATAQGAAAARFDDLVGTLEAGKRADVVLVDADVLTDPAALEEVPMLELLIARGTGSHVRTVVIDGAVVFHEGTHTWIDRDDVVESLSDILRHQGSDERWRRMADVGERLARAWESYPKEVFTAIR